MLNYYHWMLLTSAESKTGGQSKGTLLMGRPAMCLTICPCFASDTAFRIVCDTDCSSGTHTKHGFGSYLFPYSFVTGKDIEGGGLIRNL